jgi:hypothetical protein
MHRLRSIRIVVFTTALLAAIGVVGCAEAGVPVSRDEQMPPTTTRLDIPTGSEEIVIQFSSGGGLSGPCCAPWEVPEITLYGAGRVVFTEGIVGMLPGMRQGTLDRGDVVGLLDEARTAGLLDDPDTGTLCCDLGYTRVVLGHDGERHELSVVGLGQEGNDNAELTHEQLRIRNSIGQLHKRLKDLANASKKYGGYAPAELAVYVAPSSSPSMAEPTPWPLDVPLTEGGTPTTGDRRCLHITDGSRSVVAAARKAKTPDWISAGRIWWVSVRPLLPHEHSCL